MPTQTPEEDFEVTICNHQTDSPLYTWPDVCVDLQVLKNYGHTWYWMCLLRPGVIKQHKPNLLKCHLPWGGLTCFHFLSTHILTHNTTLSWNNSVSTQLILLVANWINFCQEEQQYWQRPWINPSCHFLWSPGWQFTHHFWYSLYSHWFFLLSPCALHHFTWVSLLQYIEKGLFDEILRGKLSSAHHWWVWITFYFLPSKIVIVFPCRSQHEVWRGLNIAFLLCPILCHVLSWIKYV